MMKRNLISMISVALLAQIMAGCGHLAEEIATMTAAAWTPIPLPPIPKPVPSWIEIFSRAIRLWSFTSQIGSVSLHRLLDYGMVWEICNEKLQ